MCNKNIIHEPCGNHRQCMGPASFALIERGSDRSNAQVHVLIVLILTLPKCRSDDMAIRNTRNSRQWQSLIQGQLLGEQWLVESFKPLSFQQRVHQPTNCDVQASTSGVQVINSTFTIVKSRASLDFTLLYSGGPPRRSARASCSAPRSRSGTS